MAWTERAKAGNVGGASRQLGEWAVVEDAFKLDDNGLEDLLVKHVAADAFREVPLEQADYPLPNAGVVARVRWEEGPVKAPADDARLDLLLQGLDVFLGGPVGCWGGSFFPLLCFF